MLDSTLQTQHTLNQRLKLLSEQYAPELLSYFHFAGTKSAADISFLSADSWSENERFESIIQLYADFSHYEDRKPLISLWSQWYFGLLLPPVMAVILATDTALNPDAASFPLEIGDDNGRPKGFLCDDQFIDVSHVPQSQEQKLCDFIQWHLIPDVERLVALSPLNARFIWNNIGFVLHWYLGEMTEKTGNPSFIALRGLFQQAQLPCGTENPLYRTVLERRGELQRRGCCLRYVIPHVDYCDGCPKLLPK
ncbi:siderophore-iron reductase FhuF [Algicola sagamiensis]|uniref:siderophore-iron reductase FhuF n=1 Tax=Algicola sagamiensis TaxID=163869 RepID=UPI00039F91AA|nr:siderophore-iron reductase FhuF [Algicola sagamiensis]